MNVTFYKYQGTGNDFVLIDNRNLTFPKNNMALINSICNRHFGVGADGLILLEKDDTCDFKMIYFNADGNESSMCGNGGRCIVAFAYKLGIFSDKTTFTAIDGVHHASIKKDIISLQMIDVQDIEIHKNHTFLNTGSPHHVEVVASVNDIDVAKKGKELRNSYGKAGSNINFVEKINHTTFKVRTYERGVEDETLACGTGVTAVAIAMHKTKNTENTDIILPVKGGILEVTFDFIDNHYKNVFLKGPAAFVFKGVINTNHIEA